MRSIFKSAQLIFDKKYRYFKRKHEKEQFNELETFAQSNPAAMWKALKRLNNPPNTKAALEIVRQDGSISADIKEVLERWLKDISRLFSGLQENPDVVFDEAFYEEVLEKKREFEELDDNLQPNPEGYDSANLNEEITYDEVSEAVDRTKMRKSYLEIPNEALKNKHAKLLLHKFFNLCFVSGYNPSDWDFSITIVCCVAKIYSSILNKRLQKYLETNNILVEEQNGFRTGRSCIDHIFVMCSVLRNRKMMGKDTFLCFIDYKKNI